MLVSTLLTKKRDGGELTNDEIRFLVNGYCDGEVADYQMSAWAMAVCIRGMNAREITTLTEAMLQSGDRLPRSVDGDGCPRVDKHSTGGLGDKVSLILAPLLAACGVEVPMISGRGLGLTGGTLDKLESIEGFRTQLDVDESTKVLRDVGAFIIGANERIAPADRKLYALRDVTGTVESVPLITASILSKKLAANLDALVMDVKTGSGAFMKSAEDATHLAESLVRVGCQAGLPTTALLSDMDQPLGWGIGNSIEVTEAIEILRGNAGRSRGGGAVRSLCIELAAELLLQVKASESLEQARLRLEQSIDRGDAWERFERMVRAQGGRLDHQVPLAPGHEVLAAETGFVAAVNCRKIGETIVALGGGRRKQNDPIDHSIGVAMHARIGDRIERGQPIFRLHAPTAFATDYLKGLESAMKTSETPVPHRPLISKRIGP